MLRRHALLEGIIDYAGLFPPAGLAMEPAVEEFARQRAGDDAWMLAAFVVPAARLGEFAAAATRWRRDEVGTWPLSVLLGGDPTADLEQLARFAAEYPALAHAVALEWRPAAPAQIADVVERAPAGVQVFCELPWDAPLEPWLAAVRAAGAWAKIRTGGVTADLVPPLDAVARFLRACHTAEVGLKFTAGLHHPVRAPQPLSYATHAPTAVLHGFLNVFFAAALLARAAADDEILHAVLSEQDPASFDFEQGDGLRWRSLSIDGEAVRAVRASFARSFGSCSFAEPLHDLQQLGKP